VYAGDSGGFVSCEFTFKLFTDVAQLFFNSINYLPIIFLDLMGNILNTDNKTNSNAKKQKTSLHKKPLQNSCIHILINNLINRISPNLPTITIVKKDENKILLFMSAALYIIKLVNRHTSQKHGNGSESKPNKSSILPSYR